MNQKKTTNSKRKPRTKKKVCLTNIRDSEGFDDTLCKTCKYRSSNFTSGICDYILLTGKIRGCDIGPNCNKYKEGPRLPNPFGDNYP